MIGIQDYILEAKADGRDLDEVLSLHKKVPTKIAANLCESHQNIWISSPYPPMCSRIFHTNIIHHPSLAQGMHSSNGILLDNQNVTRGQTAEILSTPNFGVPSIEHTTLAARRGAVISSGPTNSRT